MKPATAPRCLRLACLISAAHAGVFPAFAQEPPVVAPSSATAAPTTNGLTYADIVDLAQAAPLVAHVRIRNSIALKPEASPGPGRRGSPTGFHQAGFRPGRR